MTFTVSIPAREIIVSDSADPRELCVVIEQLTREVAYWQQEYHRTRKRAGFDPEFSRCLQYWGELQHRCHLQHGHKGECEFLVRSSEMPSS